MMKKKKKKEEKRKKEYNKLGRAQTDTHLQCNTGRRADSIRALNGNCCVFDAINGLYLTNTIITALNTYIMLPLSLSLPLYKYIYSKYPLKWNFWSCEIRWYTHTHTHPNVDCQSILFNLCTIRFSLVHRYHIQNIYEKLNLSHFWHWIAKWYNLFGKHIAYIS